VSIEVNQSDWPMDGMDGAESGQGNRMVTTEQHDTLLGRSEQMPQPRLDGGECVLNVEGVACDVTGVHDLGQFEWRSLLSGVIGPQQS
jgi:hypothetical protein